LLSTTPFLPDTHYYLTLYRIQLKTIRSRPFLHTLQIQVQLINTY
jgi:hypothetical protein